MMLRICLSRVFITILTIGILILFIMVDCGLRQGVLLAYD
uniref:Uncharacterized protein n=1 Tax=Bartonella schoenbuchensis (strain DSM 13525 / NCTC 13165 / R1) TaxID=687861 RepID=E6YYK5_BARSR|nr:hypothetical protein B11C_20293 [Bartonella schoenbuchensis R1]